VLHEWGKEKYIQDLAGMRKGKTQFGITKRRKQDDIKIGLQVVGRKDGNWIELSVGTSGGLL